MNFKTRLLDHLMIERNYPDIYHLNNQFSEVYNEIISRINAEFQLLHLSHPFPNEIIQELENISQQTYEPLPCTARLKTKNYSEHHFFVDDTIVFEVKIQTIKGKNSYKNTPFIFSLYYSLKDQVFTHTNITHINICSKSRIDKPSLEFNEAGSISFHNDKHSNEISIQTWLNALKQAISQVLAQSIKTPFYQKETVSNCLKLFSSYSALSLTLSFRIKEFWEECKVEKIPAIKAFSQALGYKSPNNGFFAFTNSLNSESSLPRKTLYSFIFEKHINQYLQLSIYEENTNNDRPVFLLFSITDIFRLEFEKFGHNSRQEFEKNCANFDRKVQELEKSLTTFFLRETKKFINYENFNEEIAGLERELFLRIEENFTPPQEQDSWIM